MSTDPTQTKPADAEDAPSEKDEVKDDELEHVTGGATSNAIKTRDDAAMNAVRNIKG